MLTNIQRYPVRYAPGTQLTSKQQRDLVGVISVSLPVGATIAVPEHFEKVFVTERLGKVVIERCFFSVYRSRQQEMIPAYVKIYDAGTAHVLLLKEGMQYLLNLLTGDAARVTFLKDAIFKCAMVELENIDSTLYAYVQDFYDSPTYNHLLANDEVSAVTSDDAVSSIGYPWNIADTRLHSLKFNVQQYESTEPTRVANFVHDLSVQVSLLYTDDMLPSQHPLFGELIERFTPQVGELYEQFAFDNLTSLCLKEPALSSKEVLKNSGILWKSAERGFETTTVDEDRRLEKVQSFPSELLQLCVWIHQLPYYELALRYTLPKRNKATGALDTPSSVTIAFSSLRNDIHPTENLLQSLDRILRYWDVESQYTAIDLVKTGRDELFITFIGKHPRKMYVDLAITTLLSQSIVRIK